MGILGWNFWFLLTFFLAEPFAQNPASYKGKLELPVDLYTQEGTPVQKGRWEIETGFENGHCVLRFLREGKNAAVIVGRPSLQKFTGESYWPLTGTALLRPATEPVLSTDRFGSDEERFFGKSGREQYEPENRDWPASIRVYKAGNGSAAEVYFIFQERTEDGQWNRTDFTLFLRKEAPGGSGSE